MNTVGNPRIEDHWDVQQTYPLWKELPTDVTCNQVLTLLDPLDLSKCSVVCEQWNRFLTSKDIWEPLSRYHFPSLTPGFLKSFQAYQLFYSNLSKGICSVKTLREDNSEVLCLALSGTTLISGHDKTIKIWDLESPANTCTATLGGHTNSVCSLALMGTTLISGSLDNTIKIWDLNTNTCTDTLKELTHMVFSLVLKGTTLISGSYDGTIKIWDLSSPTNTCTATLKGHTGAVSSLALRGTTLISGSYDRTIKIWDLETNTCIATLEGHASWVCGLALKDTTLFSGGSGDATIKIWDLRTNTCTNALFGHPLEVLSLAIKDTTLFSGSSDTTIKIWDLNSPTNICTATLLGHTSIVNCLLFKDATLFSGSDDRTIKIWDFAASHAAIFMEIASALEGKDPIEAKFAMDRFLKMPSAAKNKIFNELYKIIKSELKRCAEDVFYGKNEQIPTNAQRAKAIRKYLDKLPKY
jgi:WD40 repeat protein